LGGQELVPTLKADVEVAGRDLQPDLLRYLDLLQPTGQENPEATFITRGMRVMHRRTVGGEGQHLKMKVSDGWITWDAIAFRQGHQANALPERVDLLYTFERNVYNGQVSLQLNVRDLKPSQT
jgi:single-stranded-DNA-specific exonuclease